MKRKELKALAKRIAEQIEEKGYAFWKKKSLEKHEERCREEVLEGEEVQICYTLLEDEPAYLQIGLSLSSEGSFIDSYFPVSYSVVIEKET
jgi:hypothetical protein